MAKTAGRRIYRKTRGKNTALGAREKKRLIQLGVCLFLFLAVYFGKGGKSFVEIQRELTGILQSDVNIDRLLADMDWSVASGRSADKTLGELLIGALLPKEKPALTERKAGPLYRAEERNIGGGAYSLLYLDVSGQRGALEDPMSGSCTGQKGRPVSVPESIQETAAIVYTGPALPEKTSMDRYDLGLAETVSPVMGYLNSPFGWREHPIEGDEKFHCGVDLSAEKGTTVKAFAAGRVDYIGESDIYGQYLQLRHDNGVTTFYAHCSKLCVQQGQRVTAGQKVAESGATGEVTGPHLHFEIKKNGIRLNPAYYIDLLT